MSLDSTPVGGGAGFTGAGHGKISTNAFGMWTVQESGQLGSALDQQVSRAAASSEEKVKPDNDGWMPPTDALLGGA